MSTILLGILINCLCNPIPTSEVLTIDELSPILEVAGFTDELLQEAIDVVICESGLDYKTVDPNAIGDNGLAEGLFQIHFDTVSTAWKGWEDWLYTTHNWRGNRLDPYDNARAAFLIYQRSGWNPWTCKPK